MEELTTDQCRTWLQEHGIAVDGRGRSALFHNGPNLFFKVSAQAQYMLRLAFCLSDWLGPQETLLQMTDWPIFNDLEMDTFMQWRARHGLHAYIIDAPGHLFSSGADRTARAELIMWLFTLNWEGYIFTASNEAFVWLADEIVEVTTTTRRRADELDDLLAANDLEAEFWPTFPESGQA